MSWLREQKGEKGGYGIEVWYLWKNLVGQDEDIQFQKGKDEIQWMIRVTRARMREDENCTTA